MNIKQRIEKQIDGLVREVALIAQEAAVAAVTEAFTGGLLGSDRGRAGRVKGRAAKRTFAKKRDSDEIASLAERLFAAISEKPGENMATLSKVVGSSPQALIVPVRRLLDSERIRTVGERNQRRYFLSAT